MRTPDRTTTDSATRIHRTLYMATAPRYFNAGLFIPVAVLLPLSRGITLSQVGLIVGVYAALSFVLDIPSGAIADRYGRKKVLIAADLCTIANLLVFTFATAFVQFLPFAVLAAFARALNSGALEAWYVDSLQHANKLDGSSATARFDRMATIIFVMMATGSVSSGLAIHVGDGHFGNVVPTMGLVPLLGVVVVAARLLVLVLAMREPPTTSDETSVLRLLASGLRRVRKDRAISLLCMCAFAAGALIATLEQLVPAHYESLIPGSTSDAAASFAIVLTCGYLMSAGGAWLAPKLQGWVGGTTAHALVMVGLAMSLLLTGLVVTPWVLIITVLIAMIFLGGRGVLFQTLLHDSIEGDGRATVIAASEVVQTAGFLLASVTFTWLVDRLGAPTGFTVACAVGVLGAVAAKVPGKTPASEVARDPHGMPALDENVGATGP
jgi:MFS family permease